MAVTNINNLDGLDVVTHIGAGGETFIKNSLKQCFRGMRDDRIFDLFIGQMAAEGFDVTLPGSLRATLESPTVKLTFVLQTGYIVVTSHFLVNGEWQVAMRRNTPGNF